MKTAETVALEKAIRWATRKTGVFGCYEVTIGFCGRTERDRESKKYLRLWKAVRKEFGDEKAWELIEKAEE